MKTHSFHPKYSRHEGIVHRLWHAKRIVFLDVSFQQFKNRHENEDLFKSHLTIMSDVNNGRIRKCFIFPMQK